MPRRRFALLAVALVALGALWSAPAGAALPRALINQFFGDRMVRAEVLVVGQDTTVQDWRIDRGTVTAVGGGTITLREASGDVVSVQLAPSVQIAGGGRAASLDQLRRRQARVTVYRPANGPAQTVQVNGSVAGQLFGDRMVRAEVLVVGQDGSVQDWRIDRGTVTAVAGGTITLREASGEVVPVQLAAGVQVLGPAGRSISLDQLRRRQVRVTVYRQANAPAQTVQVDGLAG